MDVLSLGAMSATGHIKTSDPARSPLVLGTGPACPVERGGDKAEHERAVRIGKAKIRGDPLAVEIAILDFDFTYRGGGGELGDAIYDPACIAAAKHDRGGST